LKVVRKVLKDEGTAGDALLDKKSWKEDKGIHSKRRIGNDKVKIRLELKRGKILVQIDDERPIVYRDLSVAQWYFENYFTVGNYLQSKEENCFSTVNYYKIEVVH
ncbi:polysaccharide lyase family 7 protein, partial [Schleiferiaceae bacterium]|nr:polysaccharide lyase family 7 protein [Schleiferiaceae bacterium]